VDEVVTRIEAARSDPARRAELVELLRDAHPLHRGLGGADVVRLRAFVMQCFGELGLPDDALPFVLEDLETSDHAEALAAAARALRGWKAAPALVPLLERAAARARDDYVSFASYDAIGSPRAGTTAKRELEATLGWVRANLDCCAALPAPVRHVDAAQRASSTDLSGLALEDQDGARLRFADLFLGRPAVVAFFYTRCENPLKCSLTVTRLARLQPRLPDTTIAAITYDPAFDTPARLRAYATARGFTPSPRHRALRPSSFEPLAAFFTSDVSRAGATITRHRLELYVLDAQARIAAAFEHRTWDEDAVVAQASSCWACP
jgi:protein SCO1/2